jgi:hypothetical protein
MFADDAGGVLGTAEGRGDDAGLFRRNAAEHLPEAAALLFAKRGERGILRTLDAAFGVERGLPVSHQPDHAA